MKRAESFEAVTLLVSETIIENQTRGFNQTVSRNPIIFIGLVRCVYWRFTSDRGLVSECSCVPVRDRCGEKRAGQPPEDGNPAREHVESNSQTRRNAN